jgi:hypothetical protein
LKLRSALFASLIVFGAACSPAAPPVTATSAAAALPATATAAVALYQQVTLTSVPAEEDGKSPDYKITTQTPALTGSNAFQVQAFNSAARTLVRSMVDDYKNHVKQMPSAPISASSTFDVKYQLVSPPGNIYSIKFETEGYVAGMAHPYHLIYVLNYDLEKGTHPALSDLFLPNSNYLQALSSWCAAQLSTRDIDFKDFSQGADPTPDNYKNWNITADGLMITFDEYQVAPYAAGPQTVTVPFHELTNLIDPKGPLATLAH